LALGEELFSPILSVKGYSAVDELLSMVGGIFDVSNAKFIIDKFARLEVV
jgi:hypothetical protein